MQSFLGVKFSRMEMSRVGIGGISNPELGASSGIVGIFELRVVFFKPRSELGLLPYMRIKIVSKQ